jgi:hypothetical protein
LQVYQDAESETWFTLRNDGSTGNANVGLALAMPAAMADALQLFINRDNGFLTQRFDNVSFNMVGAVHVQSVHEGDLDASQLGKLIGTVPIAGTVADVILSIGDNIVSSDSDDGVTATVKVNGTTLTTTHPQITDAAGTGMRSTAQGHGTAAIIQTDGTQDVARGDVVSVDLTRTANGSISSEASDVVVLIVIRVDQPE